jgi:hypothetical protein
LIYKALCDSSEDENGRLMAAIFGVPVSLLSETVSPINDFERPPVGRQMNLLFYR